MQVSFDPKAIDLGEAMIILGMILPAFVKGCNDQGDTLVDVQAGMSELVAGVWPKAVPAENSPMP